MAWIAPKAAYNPPMIQLGACTFDPTTQVLRAGNGERVGLRAQTLKVLECLIAANGAVMTKEHLVNMVWPSVAVTDDSLVQCIGEIRTAIGDINHANLQTERRRGYRLVATAPPNNPLFKTPTPIAAVAPQSPGPIDFTTPAIAVMPFSSLHGDERSERLAMVFAGDLISELARHKALRVISRMSSFALKGQTLGSKELCEKLKARFVVCGQVQFLEDTIDWSLEMVDGRHDEIVWSERRQFKFADFHNQMASLLRRLAGAIHGNFDEFSMRQALMRPPESLDAYDLVSRAQISNLTLSVAGTRRSLDLANQAVAMFPTYGRAWRELASSHLFDLRSCHTGQWKPARINEILFEAQRAIELDPTYALAYSSLAEALQHNGQFEESLLASDRSLALAPGDPFTLIYRITALLYGGRLDEAQAGIEAYFAMTDFPASFMYALQGRLCMVSGDVGRATQLTAQTLALLPGATESRIQMIVALEESGEHDQAAGHFKALLAHTNNFDEAYFGSRWDRLSDYRDRTLKALRAHGLKPTNHPNG